MSPQLLDRFGLFTEITIITDLDQRVEIVERRKRFDRDPVLFRAEVDSEQRALRQRLRRAKKMLARVKMDRALLRTVAELCVQLGIAGHRGELTTARSARALAAFEGRAVVAVDYVKRVALMSLRYRLRRDPLERIDSGVRIEKALEQVFANSTSTRKLTALR